MSVVGLNWELSEDFWASWRSLNIWTFDHLARLFVVTYNVLQDGNLDWLQIFRKGNCMHWSQKGGRLDQVLGFFGRAGLVFPFSHSLWFWTVLCSARLLKIQSNCGTVIAVNGYQHDSCSQQLLYYFNSFLLDNFYACLKSFTIDSFCCCFPLKAKDGFVIVVWIKNEWVFH